MAELTAIELDRIRLEEVYRNEVRQQLEKRSTAKGRLVEFLNSSLGLWLLSAIFISGAGTIYQNREKAAETERAVQQRQMAEEGERRQRAARLDDEISYRISQALLELSVMAEDQQGPERQTDTKTLKPVQIVSRLSLTPKGAEGTLYPEFSDYSLSALLGLLRRAVPADEQQTRIEESLAALAAMSKGEQASKMTAEQTASDLLKRVVLDRWKGTRFYYIDCSPPRPFC